MIANADVSARTSSPRFDASFVALVTGAGSGIGKATALALHAAGATVIAADNSGKEADTVANLGARAHARSLDVGNAPAVAALFTWIRSEFGALRGLVTCAGISSAVRKPTAEFDVETFDAIVSINLRGTFLCTKGAIPLMTAPHGGSIVHIASAAAFVGNRHSVGYCASKSGILGITRTVALEYGAQRIRVNALCPGPIETPMFRQATNQDAIVAAVEHSVALGRVGQPEEMASAALFLLSDASSYITGSVIAADGGFSAA
ncbi:MAG: SDR family oxidoreductase [Steroidobacteraceae bacterium]